MVVRFIVAVMVAATIGLAQGFSWGAISDVFNWPDGLDYLLSAGCGLVVGVVAYTVFSDWVWYGKRKE